MYVRLVSFFAVLSITACAGAVQHQFEVPSQNVDHVQGLVAQAKKQGLAKHKRWLRLVHYESNFWGGHKSEADGSGFFLDADGKDEPARELAATIRGFYSKVKGDHGNHPLCAFPARFEWLDQVLHFDKARLPEVECEKRDKFFASLNAESVSLVFSSYYLASAASAFGHTFLRINKRDTEGEERSELLDTGINYSATVDTDNAVLYAFKGLVGLFRGSFLQMPYYYKVREYNDYESRDLWSYELNLTEEEVRRVVLHVWELGRTHFDYYYLTENCSYHVLGLLDAAVPRIDLRGELGWPVLPADTLKAVVAHKGLVSGLEFRPSLRRQARERTKSLGPAQNAWLAELKQTPTSPAPAKMPVAEVAATLDAAIDLMDMEHSEELLKNKDTPATNARFELMARRAELGLVSAPLKKSFPALEAPHRAHRSRRLGLGSGLRDQDPFLAVHFRLALHDLADETTGLPKLSQIQFLPTEARYLPVTSEFRFERFSLTNIINLMPLRRYERKLSWIVDVGGRRIRDKDCDDCFAGAFEFATGYTLATKSESVATWLMADVEAMARPGLDVLGPLRFGLGARAGFRFALHDKLISLSQAKALWYAKSDQTLGFEASNTLRWFYMRNLALNIDVKYRTDGLEAGLSTFLYY
ncbi:MAG: DUF4105 domain-containing protein [Myxococcales bacterium]|nr:DUF4105 domain-containing protein [Myxococcales bacterium]